MAERDRDKKATHRQRPSPVGRRDELEELLRELGQDLPPDLLQHLEDLQKVADAGINFDDPQEVEQALRRLEYERIKREFHPRVPLYGIRVDGEGEMKPGKDPSPTPPPQEPTGRGRKRSYQDDPRYRAFYERLRAQQQKETTKYDEPPEFTPLEELEKTGWDGTPRPWEQKPRAKSPMPPAAPSFPTTPQKPQAAPEPAGEELLPGTIMRLDDGSIAIYKDAVSGKDYALFYFLEPNGVLVPRGIFLDQYEYFRIGLLPPDLFEAMIRSRRWDRDAVIYYLDRFEYAGHVRAIAQARNMVVEGGSSAEPSYKVQAPRPKSVAVTPPAPPEAPVDEPKEMQAPVTEEPPPPAVELPPPPKRDPLERGRVIRIVVAPGKVWEAVYWTSDELGPIVAHDTNREWSLMHLDLSRFKDAIEYGELLSEEELDEIEQSLARQRH